MVGRSLFTRLTLAMVATLSFVTAQIENGTYIITANNGHVLTAQRSLGASAYADIQSNPPTLQQWVVESFESVHYGFTIKQLGSSPGDPEYYLSPVNTTKIVVQDKAILVDFPYKWNVHNYESPVTIIFPKIRTGPVHVLGANSDNVDFQLYVDGEPTQEWVFNPVPSSP
ncbi:hypothetical protein B0O80DRAFT_489508 [Mortierella sp. GBAus27b]|nr:hypothetical protein BGX31_011160 [Mortierella sp. GBA43]KAI8349243.1 hypothetical protein B0O80DRAFT_489508 [Mortierella sp. GBAus27b]